MSEWQGMRASGTARVWWRRKLHDGSFLSVIHEPRQAADPLPWVWRHRGPKFHPVLGTVINAAGRCNHPDGAKGMADRYAATLPYQPSRQQELPTVMDDRR